MRPMLASTPTQKVLEKHLSETFLFVSAKLDGIRALTTDSGLVSRSLKPIQNAHIQNTLQGLPSGLDGELIVGDPTISEVFNKTSSGVMSRGGKPNFTYFVFDTWNVGLIYSRRFLGLVQLPLRSYSLLPQYRITTMEELMSYEESFINQGYEGIIVRRPDAPYKHNRATNREGYLMKVKRYEASEAKIIKVKQKFHNANEARVNELGLTSRSSSRINKIPLEQVGTFEVQDIYNPEWVFEVHGFTHADATLWWKHREKIIGKVLTYKYLSKGMKNVPRHAVFKGFRDSDDI